MKTFAIVSSLSLGVLAAGGCNDQVPPYTEARAERYAPPQIQVTGPEKEDLRGLTAFDPPQMARDDAGLLHVTVPVRATGRQVLHVQYRVTFLDGNGMPLAGSPSGWFRRELEPGGWTPIRFNSTSAQASNFQMEMRWAR